MMGMTYEPFGRREHMPKEGALPSPEESNRVSELSRSQASARRAASDGFLSKISKEARGLVIAGSLAAGFQPPEARSSPTSRDETSQQMSVEDQAMSTVEQLARNRAQAGMAQQQAASAEAKSETGDKIQQQTNSLNFYILEFTSNLVAFDVSCLGLTLPFTLPLYVALIVPILGYELYNAWNGNESLIPYFPKLTWQSFLKPGSSGDDAPPVPLPDMVLYIGVFCFILFLILMTIIETGFVIAVIYAWNNPTLGLQMFSQLIGMPKIFGL